MFSKPYTLLVIFGLAMDRITKFYAEHFLSMFYPKMMVPHFISFQLVHNYGAAYGILQNQRIFLLLVSVVVMVGGYWFRHQIGTSKWSKLGLCFLFIGTIGNFSDRLFYGYVIDFVDIKIFPLFNVADVSIDAGIGCFLLDIFRSSSKTTRGLTL